MDQIDGSSQAQNKPAEQPVKTQTLAFRQVTAEMDSRYQTGVPVYVHVFIDGLIFGLRQNGLLFEAEAEALSRENEARWMKTVEEVA